MIDEPKWHEAVATAVQLDKSVGGSAYLFTAAIFLYCTEQIVTAIRETKHPKDKA